MATLFWIMFGSGWDPILRLLTQVYPTGFAWQQSALPNIPYLVYKSGEGPYIYIYIPIYKLNIYIYIYIYTYMWPYMTIYGYIWQSIGIYVTIYGHMWPYAPQNIYLGCLGLYFVCLDLYFECLDLYFGCLDLYLCVWTCILDTTAR